ncbi:TPA: hypothetical protein ACN7N4_002572 [Klebsiella pneumoniae]|uniref:hypothetical protein n=4 Tax=Klebsiella pneumoniae TaxID=573 RepID=UPI00115B0E35|nr:hypothetical protein [Klebsiella pneumoniae]MCM6151980.1 hypothetical protein [Klebsiella pneumoniae]MDG0358546.1 hypothetical protein [Klebsiella pneumoniae]GKI28251.1 hypothetical protein NUBL21973_03380 [Klebsiella pneumoniae]HBQ2930631.1 hypothetical protein [Klebsiella pneumoniae]HBW3857474.1 hypothetical protein [Klebsiella pneumoniae]
MGRANPLYGANFTDPRMPIFYPYPGLTDGSLGLLDAYEVDENFNLSATGTDISTTPNLAAIPAATLTGVSQADLDFKYSNTLGSTEVKFERTPKLGIHGIVSQVNQVSGHLARFRCPGILPYVVAHQNDHQFAVFVHHRITRDKPSSTSQNPSEVLMSHNSAPSSNKLLIASLDGGLTGNPALKSQASAKTGTDMAVATAYYDHMVWGSPSGFGTLLNNLCRSYVLYRWHFIDLTAAGMTMAEATASEQEIFNRRFSSGGKYYGDTIPTNPSTFP